MWKPSFGFPLTLRDDTRLNSKAADFNRRQIGGGLVFAVNSACSLPVLSPSQTVDPPTAHEHCTTKARSLSCNEPVPVLGTACWCFAIYPVLLGCCVSPSGMVTQHLQSHVCLTDPGAASSSQVAQAETLSEQCRSELYVHFMSLLHLSFFLSSFFFFFFFKWDDFGVSLPAFRQGTHGIQMTSIKKRRSPDDELLYLPVSSLYLCIYCMFSIFLSALRQVRCSPRPQQELGMGCRIININPLSYLFQIQIPLAAD